MGLEKLMKDKQTAAVFCNQWGDTGKGKFCDYISEWADITARGTGGNNAGHTVVVIENGKITEKIYHMIPAGIIHDKEGKKTILGNGMVIDLEVLCYELNELDKEGLSYNNLAISKDANIIMPYHVSTDKKKNQSQKNGGIGSTGRGIGPCYEDKIGRRGITIGDLFDGTIDIKLEKLAKEFPDRKIDPQEIKTKLMPFAKRIEPYVKDTVSMIHRAYSDGKKILLEGAQGLLLSIEHGTSPYVTSSDCSLNGTATGVGLSAKAIDLPFGIVKFPFMTRVGGGPFPTELGGTDSEKYCAESHDDGSPKYSKLVELEKNEIPFRIVEGKIKYNPKDPAIMKLIESEDPMVQGIGVRLAAGEYGATTGRPRRTGWTDAVAAKYAVGINGPLMILTKPDSLSGAPLFKIAYGYEKEETRKGNGFSFKEKTTTDIFDKNINELKRMTPLYKQYEGYGEISDIREYDQLPTSLKEAISDFEKFTKGNIAVVSVGPERNQTIIR